MESVNLQEILDEMRRLRTRVDVLESALGNRPDVDEIVGKDYVAKRFGISEIQVSKGTHGTGSIPRVSSKPLKFKKSEVEKAWHKRNKPASEIAAEESRRANVRRRSTVKTS